MRIGFIGLGNMGGPMALNLIKAGHSLIVHDLRRTAAEPHLAAGARWAQTPGAAAADSEVVFTSLPGPKEVQEVALGEGGIISGLARGAVFADLSTNSPTTIRRIHAAFASRGIEVLDAPVSGGILGARNATLAVMVGGDRGTFDRIKPALDAIGDKVSYIGASGAGAVAKLVHNMIALCSTQLLAEAFTMGVKAGVSPEALLKVVQDGAYGQGMLLKGMPRMVFRGNFDRVTFALKLARKDLGLATEMGRELNVPMPIASLVEQDLLAAIANGLAEKDSTAAVTIQESRANVKIRV
jgi:3-hydroxyisobutyrate dehydrogenase-like beta-hydroxyacid dehydrogenase